MYFFLFVYFVYSLFLDLVSLRIWTLYPSSLHTKYALVWFCFIFTWFKSFVFLSCSFSSSASVWYFFVCYILILIVWLWVCVFSWENDQKLDKNRRVFCMLVNVWFCSVHVTDFPRVYVVFYCCESVLVCVRVRIFMYSLAGNSARVRISLFTLSIRFSVLEKKEKFTSIKFQVWFWRSQFYSKVVLVIRFSLTFFSLSQLLSVCCERDARGFARSAASCLGWWNLLSKFWTFRTNWKYIFSKT